MNYIDIHCIAEILDENIKSLRQFLDNCIAIYNSDIGKKAPNYWEDKVYIAKAQYQAAIDIHNIFITEYEEYFND